VKYHPLVIKLRERVQASRPTGLRASWSEYQVWRGRKILARFELERHANEYVAALETGDMAKAAELLKLGPP
jgi:hypothetical protein